MKRAIDRLAIKPSLTLIDGNFAPKGLKIIKQLLMEMKKLKKLVQHL